MIRVRRHGGTFRMTANPPTQRLRQRGARALGWGVGGSAMKVVLSIIVQATLARLLGPAEFGLFAIGIVILGVASFFSDVGLATHLIQREQVEDEDVSFVLAWNLTISLSVAALLFGGAGLIAAGFQKPEASTVIRTLALVLGINAFASISVALLRRDLDYRSIQLAEIAGYIFGFGLVGISLAASRYGSWALIGAFVSQSLATMLILYGRTRHTLRLRWRSGDANAFAQFGFAIMATNLVNWYVSSLDKLLIGRVHPQATLGLYTTVQNLTGSPANVLYPNLQSVVFSTTARLQNDTVALSRSYVSLLAGVLTLVVPAFVGVALVADLLAVVVYGQGWADAASFAGALTLMAPCILVWGISTPLLWNSDRKLTEVKVQAVFALVSTAAIALAVQQSIGIVAWTVCALFVSRTAAIVIAVCRRLQIGPARIGGVLFGAAQPVVAVCAVVLAARASAQAAGLGAALTLVAGLAAVGVGLYAMLLARPALVPAAFRESLSEALPRLPRFLRPLLARFAP